jgi:enoyl-CoA hydratase
MNDAVTIEADGHVRILTFNRPDSLNAFDDDLPGRAFSAGGNNEDFEKFGKDLWLRRASLRTGRQLFDDIVSVHLPIVAAVNGPAVGLGCTIATACDFVLVSDKAFLADPHVQVALVAGDGGAVTWPLHAGLLRAKRYLLTGDRMSPDVAVELGLATEVVAADVLMEEALKLAHKVAALPPQAVQDTKSVLNQHLRMASVTSLHYGLAAESQSHDTVEYRAVPESFRSRKG